MQSVADRLTSLFKEVGISTYGVSDVSMWNLDQLVSATVPPEKRPEAIMPECKSAIVIGIPVQRTILETAPSIYYRELYKVINNILDTCAQRIVMELENMGHKAVFIPRDGYHGITGLMNDPSSFFSHKHAAYLAGLGTFGVNNLIITEKFGPRIRFTTILTDAILPYGKPMEKQLCIKCMRCKNECPSSAISDKTYPRSRVDKKKCTMHSAELSKHGISPCGRCITVCPVGNDKVIPPTEEAIENIRRYRL